MKQIKQAHPNIKIVFVTHLLGYSADSEVYQQLFPDAIVLDDVCESHGCTTPTGERRGATSKGATFSFYFGHHITTIEGGMICTNDADLYDLMRIKRSHGMSREAVNSNKYNQQAPNIDPQFLFVTDGYNVRSTELNAVLGQQQLRRLDSIIERRRENFIKFAQIINQYPTKFWPVTVPDTNSNYSFPFVARTPEIMKQIRKLFTDYGIDHRPLVGGNLLKQPFLKDYNFTVTKPQYNVDLINEQGFYIGNSQFITQKDLEALEKIIKQL
jgi:CDP-6-deoxy-D-xylo-4-hexulose-3-dehydrase